MKLTKVLFLLCFLTFGSIVAKADVSYKFENGTLTITNTSTTTEGISIDLNNITRTAVTKLVIVGRFDGTNDFVNNKDWAITEIDMSQAVLGTSWQFKNMYKLSKIDWPTTGLFEIPAQAFQTELDNTTQQYSQLTDVTIPTNCTKIGSQAFLNHWIKNLTITGPSTYIVSQAFDNCKKIASVTVESGEEGDTNNKPYCETNAFDADITWVQTNLSNLANAAKLTYPSGKDNYFAFQNVDVLTQSVLNDTYKGKSTNGWQEFLYSNNTLILAGKAFRTFSDTFEHTFPLCENVPDKGVEVFYVTGIDTENGSNKVKLLQMNDKGNYTLPANTGILLYTTAGLVIYKSTEKTGLAKVSQYQGDGKIPNTVYTNYLESMQDAPAEGVRMTSESKIGTTEYRDMFLSNKSETDPSETGWGFYSIIPKTYSHDELAYRAFLNMPTSIFSAEILKSFTASNGYLVNPDSQAKILNLVYPDDDVTGISSLHVGTKVNSDNAYYTLTGMRVSKPGKGIYIHNGKKVIFK